MSTNASQQLDAAVVRFAGDSGDGMQTVGELFTDSSALGGNNVSTFPDFPAEIRAPIGTLPGVSGFQLHFGSGPILTHGDEPDALVAMNPAALKVHLPDLPAGGLLVVNTDAFTDANIQKAGYEENPLNEELNEKYDVVPMKVNDMTKEALKDSPLKVTDKVRCKNFFTLGFMYWVYGRNMDFTNKWLEAKWGHKPDLAHATVEAVKAGYHYGETLEKVRVTYMVPKAEVNPGVYRKIIGNEATLLGLLAGAQLSGKEILYGGYPITPASHILEGFSKMKHLGVKTIQAEDELAAIGTAIGGSFAGKLGITASSGPGLCLKSELMGLAISTELPLIIVNVQRGGPSTGLPTKTEQSDLLQALYGRHGESPMPVVAGRSPADCFDAAVEAVRIAFEYTTPVILLTDGYIGNGSEPWLIPDLETYPTIKPKVAKEGDEYVTFKRDPETLARDLAIPGTPGLEHRLGGLEKDETGSVSYDSDNHQAMTDLRAAKVAGIKVKDAEINGEPSGKLLVLGWGSTYGAITSAVNEMQEQGFSVSSVHLRNLNPFPANLEAILNRFNKVLVPELNSGQLSMLIRAKFLVDAIPYGKIQGKQFTVTEIKQKIRSLA